MIPAEQQNQQTKLANFNVPTEILNRFDNLCRQGHRTRTSMLVELMNQHILDRGNEMARTYEELCRIDEALKFSLERSSRYGSSKVRNGRQEDSCYLALPIRTDGMVEEEQAFC